MTPLSNSSALLRYLISDRRRLFASHEPFSESAAFHRLDSLARRAAASEIKYFQLREKDLPSRRIAEIARSIAARLEGSATQLLVNDRFDIALAAGAHGVHLTSRSLSAAAVRRCVPTDFLIGVSVHNQTEIKAAEGFADFAVCGPIFDTPGKKALGIEAFSALAESSTLPLFALGGVTAENAHIAIQAGAVGVAGIRLFLPSVL